MVSEYMLQQTPVHRVLPVWQEWNARWPDPAQFAEEKRSELLIAWGRLGYPRRAIRLHEAAKVITEQFNNRVPSQIDDLRSLPGVGEYTAAAITAFAFGAPSLVLDINIRRFFARYKDGVQHPTSSPSNYERKLRYELIPETNGALWAAATMEFGALVCTSKNPKCDVCPLKVTCAWVLAGSPQSEIHHKSQSWKGTDRQCRGTILQSLREKNKLGSAAIKKLWSDDSQVELALKTLLADGLIERVGKSYKLAD